MAKKKYKGIITIKSSKIKSSNSNFLKDTKVNKLLNRLIGSGEWVKNDESNEIMVNEFKVMLDSQYHYLRLKRGFERLGYKVGK